MWDTLLGEKGPDVPALFRAQLEGYDYVLDFATKQVELASAWIRQLHSVICSSQDTYVAYTPGGILQRQALPKGKYKSQPNHVITREDKIHSYAPVDLTPTEMIRLTDELNGEAFVGAHPVLQAAYAHYAFVAIHPFADGNGRVARALASVFTYRAIGVPLLILSEHRRQYFDSLELADEGKFQPFGDFIADRTLDAVQLADQSLRAARAPSAEASLQRIKRLYMTRGGYSMEEVDQAGLKLLGLLLDELTRTFSGVLTGEEVKVRGIGLDGADFQVSRPEFRRVMRAHGRLYVNVGTKEPADTVLSLYFGVEVPKDCAVDDDLVITDLQTMEHFEARINTVIPEPSEVLSMQVRIWAETIVSEALSTLAAKTEEMLKARGY
jgi:hypothetical protein